MKRTPTALFLVVALVMTSGCYYYGYPPPGYSDYDRIWDSAMRAAHDAGITITSANVNAGSATGYKNGVSVTIQVTPQADGTTRVAIHARGTEPAASSVSDDFYGAYNYYMGRR